MDEQIVKPTRDSPVAKDRLRLGPVPPWVVPCVIDLSCNAKDGVPVTDLLVNRQIHAELRQTFYHTARRLESMQAVQHESQWRLQFEPETQAVNLHWIRVRRGNQQFDHAILERFRILQREEGLERFIIDGWATLLLVMEDVRPGDIIESCFTIQSCPRLLPEHCGAFFSLVPGMPVGKFSFSLTFNERRGLKWRASTADLVPVESREHGEIRLEWQGENPVMTEPEVNTPEWYMPSPWIQVSDCSDWGLVARAVAEMWKEEPSDLTLSALVGEIEAAETDRLRRVERAIRLVQDDYRYLSVNLDLGGQVPTSPPVVVRRRFGDCKDLSFLLVHLLRRLGFKARPVLVNAALRQTVRHLLPTPNLFNHVVVELEVEGQTRWVDATLKRQGGGPLGRFTRDFGVGLPVDPSATDLIRSPGNSHAGRLEITESLLLDTTGAPSILAIIVRATGSHADELRNHLESAGLERFAHERLQIAVRRYVTAKRLDEFKYRDDRGTNDVMTAEVFEVSGFLARHPEPGKCAFQMPGSPVLDALRLPEKTPQRRTPLALPFPFNVTHVFEVYSPSLRPMAAPRRTIESQSLEFSRREKSLHNYWSMTLSLNTLTDAVEPGFFTEHEKLVEQIWRESIWNLIFPVGVPHPRRRHDFGELPAPPQSALVTPQTPRSLTPSGNTAESPPVGSPVAKPFQERTGATAGSPPTKKDFPERKRRRTSGQSRSQGLRRFSRSHMFWALIAIISSIGLTIFLFLLRSALNSK